MPFLRSLTLKAGIMAPYWKDFTGFTGSHFSPPPAISQGLRVTLPRWKFSPHFGWHTKRHFFGNRTDISPGARVLTKGALSAHALDALAVCRDFGEYSHPPRVIKARRLFAGPLGTSTVAACGLGGLNKEKPVRREGPKPRGVPKAAILPDRALEKSPLISPQAPRYLFLLPLYTRGLKTGWYHTGRARRLLDLPPKNVTHGAPHKEGGSYHPPGSSHH